ncbi:MAG: sulfite exporter TauE/SafE family protein [Clostridia bacterium]|nr:sulfite exporter TauE/SafE family protein [Clostridia bacterium]
MSWLLFVAAFCVALLSGLGVGGGGLLAVILSLFSEIPPLTVQGINLYFFLFSGAAALTIHLLRRRIPLGITVLCILFGLLGTWAGSGLAHVMGGGITRKLFGAVLMGTGILTLIRSLHRSKRAEGETRSDTNDKKRP